MREPKDVTILIVDDEAGLRKAISFDFKRRGFNVLEASSGNEAFKIFETQKVDVILSDVRMPSGDGVELLDRIKGVNPTLPVVMFITGFADLSLEDAYDKGADAVFSKPFDRKALMAAVVKTIAPKDVAWGLRKTERIESNFNIELHCPELNLALIGRVLNIGRGGIFVMLKDKFPVVETKVLFSIHFEQGVIPLLEGNGIVRWIRTQHSEKYPSGCGVEFESLNDVSRLKMIELINDLKTKSFIPKS